MTTLVNIGRSHSSIFHKHCFQFLLALTIVPRENQNIAYANVAGTNKEYDGIFESAYWCTTVVCSVSFWVETCGKIWAKLLPWNATCPVPVGTQLDITHVWTFEPDIPSFTKNALLSPHNNLLVLVAHIFLIVEP